MTKQEQVESTPKKRKRGQGEGSIFYIESKKLWCSKLTVGKDANGKQKRKEFYGKSQREVREKLTAARADMDRGVYVETSKMTLGQWLDIWLWDYKKGAVKPKVHQRYHGIIELYIKPSLGNYKLRELRPDIVQKFINELSERGLSYSTVASAYSRLCSALDQAVKNELIVRNVVRRMVTLPQREKSKIRVLTPDEQALLIETLKTAYQGETFILALATGLRIGDAYVKHTTQKNMKIFSPHIKTQRSSLSNERCAWECRANRVNGIIS